MDEPTSELGPGQFRFAPVPDSEDTRLFIELSGYANGDLTPALQALESALAFEDAGDTEMVSRFLIEFAVVAYCRAFFSSSVRGRLSDHVAVPARFTQLHDTVCAFRNTTVAHSQSELSTTWPTLVIDQSDEPFIRDVWASNVSQTLPLTLVRQLAALIEELIDSIDALLESVRGRLLADARAQDVPETPATLPGVKQELDSSFNPRTRRKSYPTQQTFYGSITEA